MHDICRHQRNRILWSILILSCSVWIAAEILPGIKVRSFWDAVIVSIVFGPANFFFGWFLFVIIGVVTIGLGFIFSFLTRLVVSALLLMFIKFQFLPLKFLRFRLRQT